MIAEEPIVNSLRKLGIGAPRDLPRVPAIKVFLSARNDSGNPRPVALPRRGLLLSRRPLDRRLFRRGNHEGGEVGISLPLLELALDLRSLPMELQITIELGPEALRSRDVQS